MIDDTIKRINALAAKAKTVGLTDEEIAERAQLRNAYLASIRRNLTQQLDNTFIVDENGQKRKLVPKK